MHMLHMPEDIEADHANLKIRQSDARMFEVGRNLALTAGKVIFENQLMQLIQYAPSTGTVLKRPLLIVPPWINKFYILDLTPEKSFVKWCVDQGLTVFVISWVNPDANLAKKGFEDYMRDGPLAALDVIEKATGSRRSTPSAIASAARCWPPRSPIWPVCAMRASPRRRSSPRRSISPMPATSRCSSTRSRSRREREAGERGYLEGKKMANAFNLRSERSDLALRDQQLSQGQGTRPIRPALLELGCNADAGGEPLVLSAQLLSGEPAEQERDGDRRQAGPQEHHGPDLQSRHPRGPSRRRSRCCSARSSRRSGALRARRASATSLVKPARQDEVPILDRSQADQRQSRPAGWGRPRARRLVVAGLVRLDQEAGCERGGGARAGGGALKPIEDAPGSYVKVRD